MNEKAYWKRTILEQSSYDFIISHDRALSDVQKNTHKRRNTHTDKKCDLITYDEL